MLSSYSDDELIEELARRRNARQQVLPEDVHHWCDDCGNFVAWTNQREEVPVNYNPCKKGHSMKFICPGIDDDPHVDYGFYRI